MYISSSKSLDSGSKKGIGYTDLEINSKGLEGGKFEKIHMLEN